MQPKWKSVSNIYEGPDRIRIQNNKFSSKNFEQANFKYNLKFMKCKKADMTTVLLLLISTFTPKILGVGQAHYKSS